MKKGFTLLEMLVVLTIIATLLSLSSWGLTVFSKNRSVGVGVDLAAGQLALAKNAARNEPGEAPNQGGRARLLIHTDNSRTDILSRERHLRYMVIQRLSDDNGTPEPEDDVWEIAGKGIYLPKHAFYSPSLSNQPDLSPPVLIPTIDVILPGDTETSKCDYFEFVGCGTISTVLVNPAVGEKAPRLVISGGSKPPGSAEPIRVNNKNVGGFVIWRNGSTHLIRHPEQVGL